MTYHAAILMLGLDGQESEKRGYVFLFLHALVLLVRQGLRLDSQWVAALYPAKEHAMELTRSQTLATLCLAVLCNMFFSALFYGTETDNLEQTILASVVSTLVMFPVKKIIPKLYESRM